MTTSEVWIKDPS